MKLLSVIKSSFKNQIFMVLMSVTLILVIVGGVMTIQGFQTKLRLDYEASDIEQNHLLIESLQTDLDLAGSVLRELSANPVLIDAIESSESDSIGVYSELYEASTEVRTFANVDIYRNGNCIYSTRTGDLELRLPVHYAVLGDAQRRPDEVVYGLDPTGKEEQEAALLIAKRIQCKIPAYAVIRIEQSVVASRLQNKINAKDGFLLTDRFLRPYCQIGTATDGQELANIKQNLFHHQLYNLGTKNNVYMSEIGDTGFLSIYITPQVLGESAAQVGYQIILIQVFVSVIVCLLVATRLSGYLSKPIGTLAAGMRRFRKGDFETKIELDLQYVFQQLAVGFNKMTTQLKTTMEERVAAERTITDTRIQMMQAQLNPHFLYNTLDTIKWVAKVNHAPEAATMSASLAEILRASISGKQFCRLGKELVLVEDYCRIQQIRFDNQFDLTIDVPGDVRQAVIPKLILQPIVENAIIHGMEDMENGHLYVAAIKEHHQEQDLLKISVQDNGKGISDEMLNALNNDDVETLKGHLGLNNVNTIIRLYYGKEYGVMGVRLSDTEGGTVMILTLPYMEQGPGGESVDEDH